ncbi:MAG: hypothetical protein ACYTGQ_13150, partial [Planctomycetota bacterium]
MHHKRINELTPLIVFALCLVGAAASARADDNADWLKQETQRLIEGCRIEGASGVILHSPDGVGHYKGIW